MPHGLRHRWGARCASYCLWPVGRPIICTRLGGEQDAPHRIGRRQGAIIEQEGPRLGIAGRIDVDGERRKRRVLCRMKAVFLDGGVTIASQARALPGSATVEGA